MKYTDIVFSCRKCGHLLFVGNSQINPKELISITKDDCIGCGEEGYENWILVREGNFDKEYGKEK